jgi:hypothetical protein
MKVDRCFGLAAPLLPRYYVIGKKFLQKTQGNWADYLSKSGRSSFLNFKNIPAFTYSSSLKTIFINKTHNLSQMLCFNDMFLQPARDFPRR